MTERALTAHQDAASGLAVHDLSVGEPGADAPVVIAIHGITANGLSWRAVADELGRRRPGGVRFLAPDLRGRAESRKLPGPWGMGRHAQDVLALAGTTRPVLVGHSMGAFVAAVAAARSPERVAGTVLVDGGLAFPPPPGTDVDAMLQAVIGPAMARLRMRFSGPAAYLTFWRAHPAVGPLLAGPRGELVEAYVLHDLIPDDDGSGEWVSTCVLEAIREDGGAVLRDDETVRAPRTAVTAGVPTDFLWAPRGLMNEEQGLYDEGRIAALALPSELRVHPVPDTNHYGIVFDERAVAAVVDVVEQAIDRGR